MASFTTGTAAANNLYRIGFSAVLHFETQSSIILNKLGLVEADKGDESTFERQAGLPFRSIEALNNARAQQVRVGMMKQLTTNRTAATGARSLDEDTYGSAAANSMIDQEETPALNDCKVYVEQSKHAVAFPTKEIQDLRTEFKVTSQAARLLSDWAAAEEEDSYLDAIYDQFSANAVAGLTLSTADPPTANLLYAGSQTANANLGSGHTLTPTELRRMADWAQVNNINPARINGRECYVLLVYPFCYTDLQGNSEWQASYQNAFRRQEAKDTGHPLFNMADAEYAGIYIVKYNRIRAAANLPNVRRNILLGAAAIATATTVRPRLVRRKEDQYEDVLGIGIKWIHGKSRFDWAPVSGTTINQAMAIWGTYTRTAA